ncbi:MAG: FtsX-like permease family protein [Actinomycetota bacterium]
MTVVAAIILAVLAPFLLFDALRRPTIRRLAIRNIVRRPGEAALVVAGAMLATALITASFIIGDSFGASIRGIAIDRWGPTDELVFVGGLDEVEPAIAALEAADAEAADPVFDGVLGAAFLRVSVGSQGADAVVNPDVRLLEVDPAAAVAFDDDHPILAGAADLAADEVVVNADLADELGVAAGDPLSIYLGGEELPFTVAGVAPASSVNGFSPLLAAPGAITALAPDPDAVSDAGLLVSNVGDTFTGADRTEVAEERIEAALGAEVEIFTVKQGLLDNAEDEAAEMTELFGTIGGFSVAAGILLVVNLFVMLAAERKSEMGTLRAVGLRRGHLIRAFSLEGALYGVLAAVAGVAVGIGLAAFVMALAQDLLASDLTIRLDLVPTSLVSGALIGLMVSQLTVLITSWRMTRLNIVRAIKDLPEPTRLGRPWRRLAVGGVGLAAGAALYLAAGDTPAVAMIAPALAAVSLIPLIDRIVPRRAAVIACCGAALVWVAAVFGLLPEVMGDPDISLFLIQGILLVGLATVMVATLDRLWLRGAELVTGGGISGRLGLAEPLARPARSSLLVAMYALVIFTITFMLVMNVVFTGQNPQFAREAGGDYDIYLDTTATAGLTAEQLAADPDVAAAVPLSQGVVDVRADAEDEREGRRWFLTGIDASILEAAPPPLSDRLDDFADDEAAWAAVAAPDSEYIIIDKEWDFVVGETYQFGDPEGDFTTLTVAGLTSVAWMVDAELVVSSTRLADFTGEDGPVTRFYLDVADGASAEAVAQRLTTEGVRQGVDARTFLSTAAEETSEQEGFLNMLQSFMGLGLLIGIAGLGVVMIRAVRERRRQFGVMRALGVASSVIRRSFVVEASFVALQGVLLGIGLGVLSAWQVLTQSTAFEDGLDFRLPVQSLIVLAIGCLVASLAMAAIPAVRAGRVLPAAALRMAT